MNEITNDAGRDLATAQIAGFWGRIGAFVLDLLLLGALGWGLGLFFADDFARMGGWGRVIGFAIASIYFGVMNSRLGVGQTLGKRALNLRVSSTDGALLSPSRSFARTAVLNIPFFLNGAPFNADVLLSWLVYPLSLAVLGLGLSIVYLYVFNRKTRQSLHDLIVGSTVVKGASPKGAALAVTPWRGHSVVVAIILVCAGLLPAFTGRLAKTEPFASLLPVQKALAAEPGITSASIDAQTALFKSSRDESRPRKYVVVRVTTADKNVDQDATANRLAAIVLAKYPSALSQDVITVSIAHGYDIGIAYDWWNKDYTFSPSQWQQRLDAGRGVTPR